MGVHISRGTNRIRRLVTTAILTIVTTYSVLIPFAVAASPSCDPSGSLCHIETLLSLSNAVQQIAPPSIRSPAWLKQYPPVTPLTVTKSVSKP